MRRSLTDSIVIETEDAWNGFRNGYFSRLLSRISTEILLSGLRGKEIKSWKSER